MKQDTMTNNCIKVLAAPAMPAGMYNLLQRLIDNEIQEYVNDLRHKYPELQIIIEYKSRLVKMA